MAPSSTQASLGDAAATRILETVSSGLWNLKAGLMSDIVDQHGPVSSLKWFATNMPTYEKILKTWGPIRTHYLAVAVSAINGCAYCTYGHAYAVCLHWFDQTGTLFPLTEEEMRDLGAQDRDQVVSQLEAALREVALDEEVQWLHRVLAVQQKPDPIPTDRDEKWLHHLVSMFGWLNACGMAAETEPDEAHDPINKNTELRRRYAAARAGA